LSLKHIVFDCDGTLVDTSQLKYSLYPGIKELLTELSENSTLYVWTARDRKSTLRILKELGVLHFFAGISTVDDALPKPHVSGLFELLGDTPRNTVCMIGDTSNDILGAKNYGIKSIGAVWNPASSPAVMKELNADFVTNEPTACLVWINHNL
jgi:phosphoglycolate phosphatase